MNYRVLNNPVVFETLGLRERQTSQAAFSLAAEAAKLCSPLSITR